MKLSEKNWYYQVMVNSLRAELDHLNKIRTNNDENGPDYKKDLNNNNDKLNDNIDDNIIYVDTDENRKINFKYNYDQNNFGIIFSLISNNKVLHIYLLG